MFSGSHYICICDSYPTIMIKDFFVLHLVRLRHYFAARAYQSSEHARNEDIVAKTKLPIPVRKNIAFF